MSRAAHPTRLIIGSGVKKPLIGPGRVQDFLHTSETQITVSQYGTLGPARKDLLWMGWR